ILLVLASPVPPFSAIPKAPLSVLIPQLSALCALAVGTGIGWRCRRPLLALVSTAGLVLSLWQVPYIDQGCIEAAGCHRLSSQGTVAQASIINSNWSRPTPICPFLGGGGGHPSHTRDSELSFSTGGRVQIVHASEHYPYHWHAPLTE